MKDSEFIELLNLYLDHEISAADAAKLEAEVQTNPARRRIYQQYCRMQKACKMVAADFQTDADIAAAVAEKKVVAFDPAAAAQRKRTGALYIAGSIAAMAACVVIAFVGRSRPESDTGTPSAPVVAQSSAPAEEAVEVKPNFVAASTAAPRGLVWVAQRPQTALVVNPLLLTGNTQAEAVLAAAVQQANHQLAWIDAVQLTPLQQRVPANELHFDATLRAEERALGNRSSSPTKQQPGDEMVTFQFGMK